MSIMSGRSAFLSLLESEGVTHLFGNPGTTELPIMHALKDHPGITYVMAMQESLVVGMADGFSRASGQLVACNVHVAPGLGNAMGAIFNAKFTGTPMIVTAGQQEQGHGLMEPLLYDPLVRIAEPLVKWSVEVTRLEDLPRIVRRAAKIAMAPPTGPVFISLPGDILNAEADLDLGHPTRVETRIVPSAETLARLVDRIAASSRPVIVVGDEIVKSDALHEVAAFAEALGCPAYQQTIAYGAHFASRHPCYMGALPRNQAQTAAILAPYDLLIAIGADPVRMSVYSADAPLPQGMPIVHLGLSAQELGKNFPTEFALAADLRDTLRLLTPAVRSSVRAARVPELAARNWSTRREALAAEITNRPQRMPIDPDLLALRVVEAMPAGAIMVDEGLTASRHIPALREHSERYGYHALASGGIGWGLPAAVGVSLAQPGRPVVCFQGDGSAMYSIQALWTAAHHKLPLTVVLINNGGYRIIKQRLLAFHNDRNFVGMDFADPAVDFTALAGSLGLDSTRISRPDDLGILAQAFADPRPKLLEIMVDPAL